uniref:Niban-like protein 2 n=1 Tax=Macrostomum lignano TaxID=282301 RepID=A0A1I8FIV5_9PLAT
MRASCQQKAGEGLLGEVQSQVTKTLEKLADDCFKAFPRLLLLVKEKTVVKAIEAQEAECRADLAKPDFTRAHACSRQDSQFSEKLREFLQMQKESPHFVFQSDRIRLGTRAYLLPGLSAHRGHGANVRAVPHARQRCPPSWLPTLTRLFAGGSDQVDILDLLRERGAGSGEDAT